MTEPDATIERRRDVARTYDRLAAQITWLLAERGVDDAAIARAVLGTMRGEASAEPFTTAGHRNVLGRLALLWLWRGPVLASLLVVSGPARLERIAAGTTELPRAPAGYWVRGRVRALRGDSSGALDAYEIALALEPTHAATYSARADVFVAMGDPRRALADLDKAVALSGAGTMYYNRGTVKFAMADYRGAGADFTAAIERDPRDLQAHLNRGAVSYFFGDHEATLRDFRRATEIAPTHAQARMKYGVMLYELGRKSEALVELRAALSCAPADWPPRAQIEGIIASIV